METEHRSQSGVSTPSRFLCAFPECGLAPAGAGAASGHMALARPVLAELPGRGGRRTGSARRAPRLRGTASLRGDIPEPCPWLSQHAGQKGRPPHALGHYCRRQDHTRGRLLTGGHRSVHQSQTGARPLRSPVAVDPLPAPGGQGTAVWGVALGTRFIRLKADEHPLLRGVPSCRPGARGSGSRRGPSGGQSPHITPAAL